MADKSAGRSDNYISTQSQSFLFLFKPYPVIATVYGNTRCWHEIREPFHLLVNLLCQFTGRRHDDAIDGIVGIPSFA